MYAAIAVLAALARRNETGRGDYIDIGMLDVGVAFLANQAMNYLVSGKPPRRTGNAHPNIQPQDVFASRDGHMVLVVGNDGQFAKCCEVLGRPEWASDERFAKNAGRVRNLAVLTAADRRDPADARHAPTGSRGSKPPAFPAARSTPSRRCSRRSRCATAGCWPTSPIRWPGRCRRS